MGAGRKRRRGGGELARAAEIVMVLTATGEARGGRAPTAPERALAAEAREALATAVVGAGAGTGTGEALRSRELFPRDAVRALVEDLGLTRATDPAAVRYRPRRASIAERVLLTKRKMEEVKAAFAPSTTNVPKTTTSSAKAGLQHEASKATTGSPRNLSIPMASPVISKQPLLNGTVAGASSIKPPSTPSIVPLPLVGSADVKVEKVVNGSNFTQRGGAETIDQASKSYRHTATSSSQAGAVHPVTGSVVMGHQAPSEESVKKQSIFSNHKAIAKNIERILKQPVIHPSWAVPSTKYMNTRLDCKICKVPIANMESLLVCDACERGMHLKCLQHYGNQGLSKAEWYCPTCMAHSKGKPLPPKYGKVTKTFVPPKSGVTQPSLQAAAENPTKKDSSKEVAANENVIKQNFYEAGSAVSKSGTLALATTSSKALSIAGAGPQKENVKHDESSSIEKERNGQPCGGMLTENARFCNEVQSNGASTGGSRMHIESSSTSSVNNSTLQSTALSGLKHSGHSFIVPSVENCESTGTSYQHPGKNVQMASTRTPTDEMHQADGVTNNGTGKPHKQEIMAEDAIADHDNAHQVTINGHICSEHEIIGDGYVGCSTASIVDWVGDGLKAVDNKAYYNSCKIDGILYNRQDHILIASKGGKSGPCKLQSLWEEHNSGSKLAMVNPYFFGSDIPESISKPCTDEEDEVYGSNNEIIVLVSAICGPCEVLHVDKFREETKRRCHLDGCRLHPIFFCRWKYDECTCSFYKDC